MQAGREAHRKKDDGTMVRINVLHEAIYIYYRDDRITDRKLLQ